MVLTVALGSLAAGLAREEMIRRMLLVSFAFGLLGLRSCCIMHVSKEAAGGHTGWLTFI